MLPAASNVTSGCSHLLHNLLNNVLICRGSPSQLQIWQVTMMLRMMWYSNLKLSHPSRLGYATRKENGPWFFKHGHKSSLMINKACHAYWNTASEPSMIVTWKLSCQQEKSAKNLALSVQQIFSFLWLSVAVALGFLVWTLYDKIKVKDLHSLARHVWTRLLVQFRTKQRLSMKISMSILNGAFWNCARDFAGSEHSLHVQFLDSCLYH